MELGNVSFKGLKFNKSVPEEYRKVIMGNTEISQKAASKMHINVALREAHCEADNDTWKILKFKMRKKGWRNIFDEVYKTIISAINSDAEVLEDVKKIKAKDLLY